MKKNKDTICIIPARGGSKGIRKKNLIEFNGKPLIAWTIEAAKKIKKINRIIVSSENKEILDLAKKLGAEVPFVRPKNLSADHVHATRAVLHAITWLDKNENYTPENIIMLLPTSPLRRANQISDAINIFQKKKPPSVIGVLSLEKYLNNLRYILNERLINLRGFKKKNFQRQELKKLYAVNGAIFITKTKNLMRKKTFHLNNSIGFEMDFFSSVDINEKKDLNLANDFLKILKKN